MDEIVLGSWGGVRLVLDMVHKKVKIISPEEILEDRYGNPLLFPDEVNNFVKIKKVSFFQNGEWIYIISDKTKLKELFRKFDKRGIPFEINPLIPKFLKDIIATDITGLSDLPIPA